MKKITTLLIACFTAAGGFAQQNTRMASPGQLNATDGNVKNRLLDSGFEGAGTMTNAKMVQPLSNQDPKPAYRTNSLSPIGLGRASNALTALRTEQNQVIANDSLNVVAVIHRQDITIWGGGTTENGKFRYDLSIDGGNTFTSDIGPLQTTYTNYGRYPNISLYNPGATTNPFDSKIVYCAPTNKFPTPGWIGHVYGISEVTVTTPATTEHYLFDNLNTTLPGGLCQGQEGEFWAVDFNFDGTNYLDSLYVSQGTWNGGTSDLDWTMQSTLAIPYNLSVDGITKTIGPNIAFSPDGQDGWIGFLSDLTGGPDSAFMPCFIHSTDGGDTWGTPIEANLNSIAWIADSLKTLWITVDSVTGDTTPASSGLATTAFDYDLTVDANGNPHIAAVVGTWAGAGGEYSISSGIAMFFADITTEDGGATFDATYIAPVLTLRGEHLAPDPDGNLLTQDNNVQIGRDESGQYLFYAWVDSDTSVSGFGSTDNLTPNLRIAGMRVSDGFQTCYKMITDGDVVWDGKALIPAMSPIVKTVGSDYYLPITMIEPKGTNQQEPFQFWYFGNHCGINESEFMAPGTFDLSWGNTPCYGTEIKNPLQNPVTEMELFPNPTSDQATVRFNLKSFENAELSVYNLMGQRVRVLASGNFGAGVHEVILHTSDLNAGIYTVVIRTSKGMSTEKLVVAK